MNLEFSRLYNRILQEDAYAIIYRMDTVRMHFAEDKHMVNKLNKLLEALCLGCNCRW